MTFLPVVDRELRVTARKRRTYWTRVAVAGAAIGIAGAMFLLAEIERNFLGRQLGPILFGIFKWLSFAFAASAGVFLTSDCLSEEKREGTLGLLFLTDLRGYDVVAGKLLATSLRAAYGLLAPFPIIGLAFLLGGVTAGEFWRLVLVLGNTLLFSLAAGACVSSVSRDAQRAMSGTMAVMGLFLIVLPGVDWWLADWQPAGFVPRLSLLSPVFALNESASIRLGNFWTCMIAVQLLAWTMLAAASFWAPRSWHEKAVKERPKAVPGAASPVAPSAKRDARRRRLLDENPVRWLSARDRWMGRLLRIVIVAGIGLFLLVLISTANLSGAYGAATAIVGLLALVFQVWVASQSSRFLLEARRNGAIELMLVTPLRVEQIVSGHWWALRRVFLYPALALLAAQAAQTVVQIAMMIDMSTQNAGAGTVVSYDFITQFVVSGVLGLISSVTAWLAVAWFAMWMGLTSRATNIAVIKTLVFVQVLPWIAVMFVMVMLQFTLFNSRILGIPGIPYWLPQAISSSLGVGLDVFFVWLARRKVLNEFREFVTHSGESRGVPPPLPPVLPPTLTPVSTG